MAPPLPGGPIEHGAPPPNTLPSHGTPPPTPGYRTNTAGVQAEKAAASIVEEAEKSAYPENYWEYSALKLKLNDYDGFFANKGASNDKKAKGPLGDAKIAQKKGTVPLEYVKQLQEDLIQIGYLPKTPKADGKYGPATERAIKRFQRHAKRIYRLKSQPGQAISVVDDLQPSQKRYIGDENGVCDQTTAAEIRTWVQKFWINPVGRFALQKLIEGGKLRSDAAAEWEKLVEQVRKLGGSIEGPYGDTTRALAKNNKEGASKYSFHYCGRAVDINQNLANRNATQKYYIVKDPQGESMYWTLYSKTEKQDGTQGTKINKGQITCWDPGAEEEYPIREGYYINLTDTLQQAKIFSRIHAQSAWNNQKKSKKVRYDSHEWWHFQYTIDIQSTFQDELELVGFNEQQIRNAGWKTDDELDNKPG